MKLIIPEYINKENSNNPEARQGLFCNNLKIKIFFINFKNTSQNLMKTLSQKIQKYFVTQF